MSPPAEAPALALLLAQAAAAVQAVRSGRSLTEALAAVPVPLRAGTQALAFHALRGLGAAQALRARLVPRPPAAALDALLLTALALLWPPPAGQPPPYPDHTLVDQAVAAARRANWGTLGPAARSRQAGMSAFGRPGGAQSAAAGFVNAVLRRYLRERDALVAAVAADPEAAYNHPRWWLQRVRADWPAQWPALLAAANRHPPMTLRVNARRGDAAGYVERLAAGGLAAWAVGTHTVVLAAPCPVGALPGFDDGAVSVQDAAAQRAAPLLLGAGLAPGARVLDACAAPGGKTAHLLELAELDLLALDRDAARLERVRQTLQRLGLRATLQAADAGDPRAWWDGRPFDAILLDAPCTASGIVRRHPDVRWLRRPADVAALAREQARLLDALWPLLAPGGRLLYATCSIFKAEGVAQIDAFVQRQPPGSVRLDPASPGHLLPLPDNPATGCAAEAPAGADPDGFYYALLHRP
jgi:16S rRNA (cytosine967-C5)-methyltransferase